eukprot:6213706-Amphidinium_carterae.1
MLCGLHGLNSAVLWSWMRRMSNFSARQEDVRQELKMNGMNLDGVDIGRMWDTFDVDMNGSLSVDELVQGDSTCFPPTYTPSKHEYVHQSSLQNFFN